VQLSAWRPSAQSAFLDLVAACCNPTLVKSNPAKILPAVGFDELITMLRAVLRSGLAEGGDRKAVAAAARFVVGRLSEEELDEDSSDDPYDLTVGPCLRVLQRVHLDTLALDPTLLDKYRDKITALLAEMATLLDTIANSNGALVQVGVINLVVFLSCTQF
jgi:hypothetical protein